MKRALTWVSVLVAAIVLLVIAAAIALPFVVDTPRVQALIVSTASQALGRPVKFASVSVAVLPRPAVKLHDLEVADDPQFGSEPFLKLETGRLALKLSGLLTGRVEFGDLTLGKPVITLIRNPDGVLNVASLGGSAESHGTGRAGRTGGGAGGGGAPAALPGRVKIEKGTVTYIARGKGGAPARYRVEDLDLTVGAAGGALTLDGAARVTPGDLRVTIAQGRVALNGGRTLLDAPLAARVGVDAKDIAGLVAAALGPTPALAGPVKGTFSVSGTLGAPKATGTLELATARVTQEVAACPEPRRRTLTVSAVKLDGAAWDGGRLRSRPVTASLAGGTIALALRATLDHGVRVELADLAVKRLQLEPVLVDFLCQGYAVSGPLDLDGALAFSAGDVLGTLSGPGRLRIGPGRVVGARALALLDGVGRVGGVVSSLLGAGASASPAGLPLAVDSITGTYQIANGVVTTRDLLYSSRPMKLAVAGQYGLVTGRMNLDMVVSAGRTEVKAKVTGTAASPSVRLDPSSVVGGTDRKKVEGELKDLLKQFR